MPVNMLSKSINYYFLLILSVILSITGCYQENEAGVGDISLSITDAPLDSAAKVVIAFSGVSIKYQNGPAYDINFVDDNNLPVIKKIDLLALQGSNSEPLLVNYPLPAGDYQWMRLDLVESMNSMSSYIELEDGSQHPLYVPSGDQTGLKLNRNFSITNGGAITFIIDFDLRKSILPPNKPGNPYKLKPTLRIMNIDNVGHLYGNIGAITLADPMCTGTEYSVYVYTGHNVIADDVDGLNPEPISSSLLSNTYDYAIGFLEQGEYTVSITCEANNDIPGQNDAITFFGSQNINIVNGKSTALDFN